MLHKYRFATRLLEYSSSSLLISSLGRLIFHSLPSFDPEVLSVRSWYKSQRIPLGNCPDMSVSFSFEIDYRYCTYLATITNSNYNVNLIKFISLRTTVLSINLLTTTLGYLHFPSLSQHRHLVWYLVHFH